MNTTELRPMPIRSARLASSPLMAPADRPQLMPNATLFGRIDLTPSVARFVVRPDGGVDPFAPGQYFALGLTVDGRSVQRPYSTASASGSERDLEFLVRLVPGGTFTPHLWQLRSGDRLRIGRAKGLFTLRPHDLRSHLFLATGTGLAPFVSMLETLVAEDAAVELGTDPIRRRAVIVHGVSHVAELAYRDRLECLAMGPGRVHYAPIVSRPTHPGNSGWAGLTGRLEARLDELCDAHGLDPADTVAYLCGNPEMITSAERILAARGFAQDAIVSELYWPASGGTLAGRPGST